MSNSRLLTIAFLEFWVYLMVLLISWELRKVYPILDFRWVTHNLYFTTYMRRYNKLNEIFVVTTGCKITYHPRNVFPGTLLDTSILRAPYNYHRSCTADNTVPSDNVDPYILPDIGISFPDCTSHYWHTSCHILDQVLEFLKRC